MLSQLNISNGRHIVPELAVSLALDRHDPHRELTPRLIADLNTGRVLSSDELGRSFDQLLKSLDDLTLDTPNAPVVSIFVVDINFKYIILSCNPYIVYTWA